MTYGSDAHRQRCAGPVTVADITMVIAVRVHDGNPWVLERLSVLRDHHDPAPTVRVVDFGSQGEHRAALEALCKEAGFAYLYEDDTGSFSLSRARNLGAAASQTRLLFFSDADCIGERDLFARLAALAQAIELGACFDQIINLPCYHLGPEATGSVSQAGSADERATTLTRLMARAAYSDGGEPVHMVAPYSNVFLCHRDFFDLIGGYDEGFRGHGSEDFELLLRFACVARQFPLPEAAGLDRFGPLSRTFHERDKPYRGFRRLFELMAFQAEAAGLRVAHLYHPTHRDADWVAAGDRRREALNRATSAYLTDERALLDCDWMPRDQTLRVPADAAVGHLLPLRLAGYRLVRGGSPEVTVTPGSEPDSLLYTIDGHSHHGLARGDVVYGFDDRRWLRASLSRPTSPTSYAAGRLSLGIDQQAATGTVRSRVQKLYRDPGRFLEDSRIGPLRWLGRRLKR